MIGRSIAVVPNPSYSFQSLIFPDKMILPGNISDWKEYDGLGTTAIQGNPQAQVAKEKVTRNFGDQLDWWERIGRWR